MRNEFDAYNSLLPSETRKRAVYKQAYKPEPESPTWVWLVLALVLACGIGYLCLQVLNMVAQVKLF